MTVRIVTNFMNSPEILELPHGGHAEIRRADSWKSLRPLLRTADLVVIDCSDAVIYRACAHFLCLPWRRRPLVAVDLVLRKPATMRQKISAIAKRILLTRADHFIHYFRDISGYARYFGIPKSRSSYVPFKVNSLDVSVSAKDIREDFIFTAGRSLRDYDTYIRAVAALPYPAAISEFSFEDFEGKDASFQWTRQNVPRNLTILPDRGGRRGLIEHMARARVVVIPTQASSLCASGISTYLDAMHLGKCVIVTSGPGASDVLSDEALLVPPHDVAALKDALQLVWQDDALRLRIAEAGRRYAVSLGGEPELLQRIFLQSVTAVLPR